VKIYLATRYSMREKMKEYRATLEHRGHKVTSRWIDYEDQNTDQFDLTNVRADTSSHAAPEVRAFVAQMDFEDIMRSEVFMIFTSWPSSRGGMWSEFGVALAHRWWQQELKRIAEGFDHPMALEPIRIMVVGPKVNVFQNHPEVEVFNDDPDDPFLNFMNAMAALQAEPVWQM
jgi:hypothetical protein